MGTFLFRLPDIGEGVAEAEIVEWYVKPGDIVTEDQSVVDVMTDKATVDMTSPVDGVVTAVHGELGEKVPVGSILVEFEVEGEGEGNAAPEPAEPAPPREIEAAAKPEPSPPTPAPSTAAPPAPPPAPAPQSGPVLASPSTRRRAKELGISLDAVRGSGIEGRVTKDDLAAHMGGGARRPRTGVSEERIIGMRRKIAERMQDAKQRIPHIAYVEEIDVTELEALRTQLNDARTDSQPKLTLLPFLMLALVRVLPDFPQINAHFDDEAETLRKFEAVHIGIATQTPAGLMVPVVTHAEARDLWDCANELARVSEAARGGNAKREELSGSTITLTSLGPLGGIASTPVINSPEVAIIAPNKIVERPVFQGAHVVPRKLMNLSASFDHRIVDGYDAALFVQAIKRLLEHPALIFMG